MDHIDRFERYSLNDPDNIVFVLINYVPEQFDMIFSKMEYVTAINYMAKAANKLHIPVLYPVKSVEDESDLRRYLDEKLKIRMRGLPPKSSFDDRFRLEYDKYMPRKEMVLPVNSENIFNDDKFKEYLFETSRKAIYLMGFQTEIEVHMSSLGAISNGMFPVVVSDATSTFSERTYFQALDLMSQVVEIIDTRDLIKIWGDW
ncbi:MAG: isochorismatase family protein [Thermoplasmataceae archaeon]